jgi:hypothetical protein
MDSPQDRWFSGNAALMGTYRLFIVTQTLRFNNKLLKSTCFPANPVYMRIYDEVSFELITSNE